MRDSLPVRSSASNGLMSDSGSRNPKEVAVRNRAEETSGHPNQIIVQTGSSVVKRGTDRFPRRLNLNIQEVRYYGHDPTI